MRRERDVGAAELVLQIAEPRQQRLLALRVARGRRDLAAEDHRDALEVAALAPRQLERIERGQVRLGDPQRALEAADGVVGALGAPEQLARAVHRVGARARRSPVVGDAGEALERRRGAGEIAGALARDRRTAAAPGRAPRAASPSRAALGVLDERTQRVDARARASPVRSAATASR